MKKSTLLSVLLLVCGFSLKAQLYYPTNTKEVQECINFVETPMGVEVSYRAKGAKKWAFAKILNNPKMGGMYLIQLPDKSKHQLTVDAKGVMQLKNAATSKIRKFQMKAPYLCRQDQTEYLEQLNGWSITSNGITQKFKTVKEDRQNDAWELSIEGLTGVYKLKNVQNDIEGVNSYELTSPDGSKKIYFMDTMQY